MEDIIKILQAKRVNKYEIEQIAASVMGDAKKCDELFQLTKSEDDSLSWHAWWVCEHITKLASTSFANKREEIISLLLACQHEGKQRLILNILMRLESDGSVSVPLLNFCFDNMLSPSQPVAVQSCCMKMAYKLCQREPELLPELKVILESAEPEFLTPATQCTISKILKSIASAGKRAK